MISTRRLFTLFFLAGVGSLCAGTATINIDVSKPGPRLNPRMYGILLENLNHAVDGGLYAELIQNRGFEDAKPPEGYIYHEGRWVDSLGQNAYDAGFARFGYFTNGLPFWSLVKEGAAQGSMQLDMSDPLTPETPRSCRLEIDDVSSGRLGIANHGFWGIGVKRGENFNLSFWARCADGFNGPLTATLEDDEGNALSKAVNVTGAAEHFFAAAGRDATSGDLIIEAINVSPDPVNATVNVSGMARFAPQAQLTVLTSGRLADNNSLEKTANVAPVNTSFMISDLKFAHDFPANSLTVLRLKPK